MVCCLSRGDFCSAGKGGMEWEGIIGMPALMHGAVQFGWVYEGTHKGCPYGCWRWGMKAVCAIQR